MGRGRNKPGRDVHGIVLLDKPVGITSNAALQQVKRSFGARKAGHTGSLDPLASGLLVICLGEATKVSAYLLEADKHYYVTARLGVKTDTGDAMGSVIREDAPVASRAGLEAVLDDFRGDTVQTPPMYSALKHQGQRLYVLAREGREVERKPRKISIGQLDLVDFAANDFELAVSCSKGTYIRTLVEDIAESAGSCAHVTALRRTRVGPFTDERMISMERLEDIAASGPDALDETMEPVDSAIVDWPAVTLGQETAWYLERGQPVTVPRAPTSGWVRLYGAESRFIGIGEVIPDGRIAPRRLFRLGGSCE